MIDLFSLEYIYCNNVPQYHINMIYMLVVSYDWAWSGFSLVNIMVFCHAPFGVKNFFPLTLCCSASGHLENMYPVSVACKTTEISHGKIGQITIYDHV